MYLGSRNMMHAVGLERLSHLSFDDGILLVSNHRSFFDLYMLSVLLDKHTPLRQPVLCPVRADFFYQKPLGVAVNLLVGACRMYPPFFRERNKTSFNAWSLERTAQTLQQGRVLVGYHPEGRRNTNADPYQPIRARLGVGQLIQRAWPIVVPAFINGLTNDIVADVRGNFDGTRCVVGVFGEPMNLDEFRGLPDHPRSHQKIAEVVLDRIYSLADEEKAARAACTRHSSAR